jgi:hypothetical protein
MKRYRIRDYLRSKTVKEGSSLKALVTWYKENRGIYDEWFYEWWDPNYLGEGIGAYRGPINNLRQWLERESQ